MVQHCLLYAGAARRGATGECGTRSCPRAGVWELGRERDEIVPSDGKGGDAVAWRELQYTESRESEWVREYEYHEYVIRADHDIPGTEADSVRAEADVLKGYQSPLAPAEVFSRTGGGD